MRTTGIFTCSVSNDVICFIGVLRVTGTVDSLASSELPCLVVASLIVAACLLQVWGKFIPVEIERKRLLKSARGMGKRYFSLPRSQFSSYN